MRISDEHARRAGEVTPRRTRASKRAAKVQVAA